jgi:hypothetical protein
VLTNGTYILASFSDPLGLGWNLFGTANIAWQPLLTSVVAPLQALALAVGLLWAVQTARRAAARVSRSAAPAIAFMLATTLMMMWLLL